MHSSRTVMCPNDEYDAALKVLNEALVRERSRNWDSKNPNYPTIRVADLQTQVDVPRPMAEQAVKERRRCALAEMPWSTDKVQ